jgi:lysophospholipase L1-like esterase
VQLGYTDTDPTDDWIGTTLPEYKANLITIVNEVRGFNGLPILITPPVQLVLDAQGKIPVYFRDRYDLIKEVADDFKTPYIDLNRISRDYLNQLDAKSVEAFFVSDHVHFTDQGAKVLAKFVVNGLPGNLGPYLKGIFE